MVEHFHITYITAINEEWPAWKQDFFFLQILQHFVNKQNVQETPWGRFKSLLFAALDEA
jgi:hypothetical protein